LQQKKILQKQQNYYIFLNLHLSKQIKTLEKNLDILLINRENNKISLTENGKVFLQYSERILALCEESCRALIDLKNGERGNLTVVQVKQLELIYYLEF
jgi:DNA-binding transcriptional LysR family regulator